MRNQLFARKALSALLILAFITGNLFNLAGANPYRYESKLERELSPPAGTIPPIITIFNPLNQTCYASNNITLSFNFTLKNSNDKTLSVSEVYYLASWRKEKTEIDLSSLYTRNNFSYPSVISVNLKDIDEGPRWIEVYTVARGGYNQTRIGAPGGPDGMTRTIYYEAYKTVGFSSVNFTIDITPPKIAISIENKTYTTPDIPLSIMPTEQLSETTYSLDMQENVTVSMNSTLTKLSDGAHKITVYAKDLAGNSVKSDEVFFSVEVVEPLTADLASVVTGTSAALLSVGLIFYVFKRTHKGWR